MLDVAGFGSLDTHLRWRRIRFLRTLKSIMDTIYRASYLAGIRHEMPGSKLHRDGYELCKPFVEIFTVI